MGVTKFIFEVFQCNVHTVLGNCLLFLVLPVPTPLKLERISVIPSPSLIMIKCSGYVLPAEVRGGERERESKNGGMRSVV